VLFFAEPLSPDDRLRLIAWIWLSLPPDHWAAPTDGERADLERKLADGDLRAIGRLPWSIVEHTDVEPVKRSPTKLYSAPRRFDLATIFAVTTAYSLLFAALSGLNFPPMASFCIAGFITGVGIGQAMLFGGKRPRRASVLVGAALYLFGALALIYRFEQSFSGGMIFLAVLNSLVMGSIMGYVAGVLVGGVFLVADILRQRFGRTAESERSDEAVVERAPIVPSVPLNAADSPCP
jgi:hypothetical protein